MSISAIDGSYDGKITIRKNQGISQAIQGELGLTDRQCQAIGKDGWESIFNEVQKNQPKQYTQGEDLSGDYHQNYVVQEGTTIAFDKDIWNKIVDIVNSKLNLKAEHIDKTAEIEAPEETEQTEQTEETEEAQAAQTAEAAQENPEQTEKASDPGKLTAKDWGSALGKAGLRFLKGFVCDEDGKFSVKKTLITAATVAAGAAIASTGVGAVALCAVGIASGTGLAIKGVVDIVKGGKAINAATTREEKLAALDDTADGVVETIVGAGTVAVSATAMKKLNAKAANASSAPEPEPAPAPERSPLERATDAVERTQKALDSQPKGTETNPLRGKARSAKFKAIRNHQNALNRLNTVRSAM